MQGLTAENRRMFDILIKLADGRAEIVEQALRRAGADRRDVSLVDVLEELHGQMERIRIEETKERTASAATVGQQSR